MLLSTSERVGNAEGEFRGGAHLEIIVTGRDPKGKIRRLIWNICWINLSMHEVPTSNGTTRLGPTPSEHVRVSRQPNEAH